MQKKIYTIIFTAFFCITNNCSQAPKADPFILSTLPEIQALEKQDHAFCSSLKIDFNKNTDLKSGLYWRCRLSLAKYRILTDSRLSEDAKHNLNISDLIAKISLKLADTPESILSRENKKMDRRQHEQCLKLGYIIATEDKAKIDDYFSCRRALIDEQQLVPPYGNVDYLDYPNSSYDIGFVVDQRIDEETQLLNAAKVQYPTCVKYNLNNVNYKNCTIAQEGARKCFGEIEKKRFKKESEEKTICQRRSYIEFPDEYLQVNDQKNKDIERTKNNSDFYNNYSFAALGIDDSKFGTEVKNDKNVKDLKKEEAKKINSKSRLYTKFELTKLRQKYIFECQKEADIKIRGYIESLKAICDDMINFEVIGEE